MVEALAAEEELQVIVGQVRHVLLLLKLHDRHVYLGKPLAAAFTAELSELGQTQHRPRARSVMLPAVPALTGRSALLAIDVEHVVASSGEQVL